MGKHSNYGNLLIISLGLWLTSLTFPVLSTWQKLAQSSMSVSKAVFLFRFPSMVELFAHIIWFWQIEWTLSHKNQIGGLQIQSPSNKNKVSDYQINLLEISFKKSSWRYDVNYWIGLVWFEKVFFTTFNFLDCYRWSLNEVKCLIWNNETQVCFCSHIGFILNY